MNFVLSLMMMDSQKALLATIWNDVIRFKIFGFNFLVLKKAGRKWQMTASACPHALSFLNGVVALIA